MQGKGPQNCQYQQTDGKANDEWERLPDYQGNDKKMPRKAEGLGTEPVVMSRVWRSWPRSIHGSLAEASVRRGVLVVLEALGSEPAATEGGLDGCRGPDGNMEIDGLVT